MSRNVIEDLGAFIKASPTAFHATESIQKSLETAGFTELSEAKRWEITPGGKYYVSRNQSSIIAFDLGDNLQDYCFHVTASHSDSPNFKLKEHTEKGVKGKYTVLNTEGYGGMICSTWMDRPLSIAGRVIRKKEDTFKIELVNLDEDLLLIPNLAIHMNRQVNEGIAFNKQVDMLPLYAATTLEEGAVKSKVAQALNADPDEIYGMDLYLYNHMALSNWGADKEFISCPQLDDLECAFASLQAFLQGHHRKNINVFACFDNEEVGSGTKQGAASTFFYDALHRVNLALGKSEEDFLRAVSASVLISCDNAHAVHPNHPEKTDQNNCVYMNEGIVVKSHAGQKYTSDGVSIAIFRDLCEKAAVPIQFFANRSDMAGGSTLGNLAMAQLSMNAVDIGLAQLAMHSAYETAGAKDVQYLILALKEFYSYHTEMNQLRKINLKK